LVLESGETVRVDAGPLALVEPATQVDDPNPPGVDELLHALDPLRRARGEVFTPIPFNVIGEALLFVGDRADVLATLEPVIARGPAAATYRDAPATVLAPRGLLALRRR